MIRSRYLAARDRFSNRRRKREATKVLQQEGAARLAHPERLEAMAIQLAEIRALPEALEPRR